nr:hypothetical protein [Tanacetum cinerariifolium]
MFFRRSIGTRCWDTLVTLCFGISLAKDLVAYVLGKIHYELVSCNINVEQVKLWAFCTNVVENPMYQFYDFYMVVLFISCAVDPQSNTPSTYIPLRAILGVLQMSLIPDTNISDFRFSDTIMSDFEDSTVTYTTVSSPYKGRSGDISPGVDGPLLVYPEYIPPEDDVFPAEEQPLPAAAIPTTDSPGYIPESDPNEDPKDDDDEDPEEDVVNYLAEHDDEEEEEEPSGDDADEKDEEQDEDDDDEEEEHPTSADSIPPPHSLRVTARISFGPHPSTLSFTKEDAERADRPEVTLPPQKRLSIVHCPGYEAGESSVTAASRPIEGRKADYGFIDSVEAEIR